MTNSGQDRVAPAGQVLSAGRTALMTANFLVAAVSGLIAIWAVGAGRAVLLVLLAAALAVFAAQLVFLRLRGRQRRLVAALEARHAAELDALRSAARAPLLPASGGPPTAGLPKPRSPSCLPSGRACWTCVWASRRTTGIGST